jgi:hypothetical protein
VTFSGTPVCLSVFILAIAVSVHVRFTAYDFQTCIIFQLLDVKHYRKIKSYDDLCVDVFTKT